MISRLLGLSPSTLLWLAVAAFGAGIASGGSGAWWVQGLRLDAVNARFDGFTATIKAQGEAAEKVAAVQAELDKRNKEKADHDYQTRIDTLSADNQRLRNARAGAGYVPLAAPTAKRPDLACFDRTELESAMGRLDAGATGILEKGDKAVIGLSVVREWAASTQRDRLPGSQAKPQP